MSATFAETKAAFDSPAMRKAACILACVWLAGCTPATDEPAPPGAPVEEPNVRQIADTYTTLRAMTRKPVFVDPELAMLCKGATQAQVEAARTRSGPHAHTAVSIFMNDLAADAFGKTSGSVAAYPVGSIIVKEKKALGYWSTTRPRDERTRANDGVGGMIKREPGYDPAHGDWEYFYFEDPDKIERGKIGSCVGCHGGAAARDYVFGGWARGG